MEVIPMKIEIKRGDMFFANLDPVIGSEQGGTRPVLIIQNDVGNKYSPTTIVVATITSKTSKTKLPTHISLPHVPGLDRDSLLLLEQLRTIDRSRLRAYVGRLDTDTMQMVDQALAVSIGLTGGGKGER
jgi:mRNA interferase MazF